MKTISFIACFAALAFSSVVNAVDNNVEGLSFFKKGAPEMSLNSYLISPNADAISTAETFADIKKAFSKAGWVSVNKAQWGKVPEATKKLVEEETDVSARCTVTVRGMHPGNGSVAIEMECGPALTFNNGVYVKSEFNTMTSKNPLKEAKNVPGEVEKLYTRYSELKDKRLSVHSSKSGMKASSKPEIVYSSYDNLPNALEDKKAGRPPVGYEIIKP